MTLPIKTARLLLRRYSIDDVPEILDFVSHPEVDRATPEIEPTESGVIKYVARQNSYRPFEQGKCFDLAIEGQEGIVIGLLSMVSEEHQQGAIGWALGYAYWGQGYASEAAGGLMAYGFRELNLHRIHAVTSSANRRSWRVMERLGMQREGVLREGELRDGVWVDTLLYAILVDEWEASQGA